MALSKLHPKTLSDLPDEMLVEIANYSGMYGVRLEECNLHFSKVLRSPGRTVEFEYSKVKGLHTIMNPVLRYLRDRYSVTGLEISDIEDEDFEAISTYPLKQLTVCSEFTDNTIQGMKKLSGMPLQTLHIINDGVSDQELEILVNSFPSVRHLMIPLNNLSDLKVFSMFTKLETLCTQSAPIHPIKEQTFKETLRKCIHLRSLEISSMHGLTPGVVEHLLKGIPTLESLSISAFDIEAPWPIVPWASWSAIPLSRHEDIWTPDVKIFRKLKDEEVHLAKLRPDVKLEIYDQ